MLRSIAAAKRRGLAVEAILDKNSNRRGNPRSRCSHATYVANAGVPVWSTTRQRSRTARSSSSTIHVVLTSTFNFTKSADARNAENVVVIDSQTVAAWFARDWESDAGTLDIDHCLLWPAWPSGDLWNLPVHRMVNRREKRDRRPADGRLRAAGAAIQGWWHDAYLAGADDAPLPLPTIQAGTVQTC
jgi:phosphatidylserine/phosphatidylglycerophosphate/cardiolipin synthase-like enzyme